MSTTEIFVKTLAGAAEIKARRLKLPQRLRTMLIMVDGTMSAKQLQDAAATLGVPDSFLEDLLDQGLIKRRAAAAAADETVDVDVDVGDLAPRQTEAERFRAAQKFMNDSVVDALGLRAFFFTLKLEKCFTCADLRAVLPDFAKLIAKGRGPTAGRVFESRARDLLG